jgi:hypothetical protein
MALSAEWRTHDGIDSILIVEDETVREAMLANAERLSALLTEPGDFNSWQGGGRIDEARRDPDAWGDLVIARAQTGEVITMDPERFWEGIHSWFRSRGVDYDTPTQVDR